MGFTPLPYRKLISDITRSRWQGKVYLARYDCFSKEVIGWGWRIRTADNRCDKDGCEEPSLAENCIAHSEGRINWEQGQQLTLDEAVAYATRKGGGRKRPATGWASLTPAEREVARLAGEGLRNDAIARRLFIAPGTVKVHLTHIFAKLGITTRGELAAQAAAHDLAPR